MPADGEQAHPTVDMAVTAVMFYNFWMRLNVN